ncbi:MULTISPECIES: hypothetical protein [Glutamicibacter]|uniref:hypothetical protein n=1 Tax=Glutamicibacter TaxID=1742989 RepID=UPI003079E61C
MEQENLDHEAVNSNLVDAVQVFTTGNRIQELAADTYANPYDENARKRLSVFLNSPRVGRADEAMSRMNSRKAG